jgi:hypothetical protein
LNEKKLTIFYDRQNNLSKPHVNMFFELNNNDYEFVDNQNHPGIDIVVNPPKKTNIPAKIYVTFDIFHNYENQITNKRWLKNWYNITSATNKQSYVSNKVISVDFIFNRTKAYYHNYPFRPGTYKWYYAGPKAYPMLELPTLAPHKTFIFLAPNRTHGGQRVYRSRLVDFLKQNYIDQGFIGNPEMDPELILHSQVHFNQVPDDSHDLFLLKTNSHKIGGYTPIHNSYYYRSFISIYAETIEYGDTMIVSEKTFDPLIRGHFILPFSTAGFIQHLKTKYGFLFPSFINYSYDSILDPDLRYQAYENEIQRLLNVNIISWRNAWEQNLNLLHHNKKVFAERPYDRIDFDQLI